MIWKRESDKLTCEPMHRRLEVAVCQWQPHIAFIGSHNIWVIKNKGKGFYVRGPYFSVKLRMSLQLWFCDGTYNYYFAYYALESMVNSQNAGISMNTGTVR